MAEKKVVGRLVNTVSFQTDRASLQKALADIKKVKDAMKGLVVPANAMRKQAAAMKQQTQGLRQQVRAKSDFLIVQKAIDKREKSQLATQEKYSRAKQKQAQAEKSIASARIRQAVGGLTSRGSGQKASQSLFADMMRNEAKMGKLQSRALADNARRSRVASQNAARVSARRMDTIGSDRFGLTSRFGAGAGRGFDSIANQFSSGAISARMYRQQVSALRRDLSSAANAQRGFNGTLKDMRSSFVQLTASYTAFAGLMGIADVGKSFQGFNSALTMGFGGEAEAAPMIEYLRKEIRRLGLDIKDTTDDFSKLAVAAKGKLSNKDIQGLFSGYMEYANVAGAGKERTALGMRAMQQMLSKGVILAEEFRSQMAEQVVGSDKAFRMAVEEMLGRALKKGELEDMMQKKKLDPEVLFPLVGKYFNKLANEGGALDKKLKQLAATESRMKESWIQFVNELYSKGVESALKKLYQGLDRVFNSIKQLAGSAIGHFLKGALDMISETVLTLLDVIQIIVHLIDQAFGSNTDAKAFAAEMLGMVVAAAALAKIFIGIKRTMMAMVGLSRLIAASAGVTAASGAAGGLATGAATGAAGGGLLAKAGNAAKITGAVGVAYLVADAIASSLNSYLYQFPSYVKADKAVTKAMYDPSMFSSPDKMRSIASSYYPMAQPQSVTVNITMDQNAKDFVKAEVQQNTQQQLNSMIPPFLRPKQ